MVINYWGAPGSGKTVAAMEKTVELKKMGLHAVFVPEPICFSFGLSNLDAKELLDLHRRSIMELSSEAILVTDMPIALPWFYQKIDQWKDDETLRSKVYVKDYFLSVRLPYLQVGRTQTYHEAIDIQDRMRNELTDRNIPYEFL